MADPVIPVPGFYQDSPKKKLCIALFNRASYSRSKSLIEEILKYPNFELRIVLSSSLLWEEYGKAAEYIKKNHATPVDTLEIPKTDGTHLGMVKAAGHLLPLLGEYFHSHSFDGVVLVADRFETLPAATAASYLNIPLIHLQGGEITGCIDDKVRHAVTKLSDYHFVSTELCKDYLREMGEDFHRVFLTGCPSIDVIRKAQIKRKVAREKYIMCIFHPETENTDQANRQTEIVMESVIEYCARFQQRCYWFYPNPDPGREYIINYLNTSLRLNSSLLIKAINKKPEDFLEQLAGARLIIGNSSCGLREALYLGVPAVNVGSRQRMRERGINVIDVGYNKTEILNVLEAQHIQGKFPSRNKFYGNGFSARAIASYLQKLDFTLKGPLTYPTWPKYREKHFGEDRLFERKKDHSTRKLEFVPGQS